MPSKNVSEKHKRAAYRGFWSGVGKNFPDLGGAATTTHYRESEEGLFRTYLPELEEAKVFKTDLWDEAKNTRILRWAERQKAKVFGADISLPVVLGARRNFGAGVLRSVVADVRQLPFREASFDAVYSMGTVEHFDETTEAIAEIYRVLGPLGKGIIGVPNRWDPFLRPLLVALLYRLGLYGYGFEKSYSRRALRQILEGADFRIVDETGILFIPGWLRMLDLACHAWLPALSVLTGLASRPFGFLERRFPGLRRHGYLLATVVERPLP